MGAISDRADKFAQRLKKPDPRPPLDLRPQAPPPEEPSFVKLAKMHEKYGRPSERLKQIRHDRRG